MPVVTMSGTIASGAREIGWAAAASLGIDYVDQQLLVDAAKRLGVPVDVILGRTYADLAREREEPEVSDALYMKTMTAIIRELGDRGNIVVLGRGSQMILRDLPGALHVLALAPQELRIERLVTREGVSTEEATRRVQDGDRARAAFHRKFWKVDVNDPSLYDMTLETSRLPFEVGVELVVAAARAKAGQV